MWDLCVGTRGAGLEQMKPCRIIFEQQSEVVGGVDVRRVGKKACVNRYVRVGCIGWAECI